MIERVDRRTAIFERYGALSPKTLIAPYYLDSEGRVPLTPGEYDGQIVLISGGSKGIGAATARRVAQLGARGIVINSRESSRREAEALVAELTTDRTSVLYVPGDIAEKDIPEKVVKEVAGHFNRLDRVIFSVGITADGFFTDMSDDQIRRVIELDLTATTIFAREVVKQMRGQRPRDGSIVFLSSIASQGNIGQENYAAAKAGINALTWSMAEELGRTIRINAVAPGPVDTELTARLSQKLIDMLLKKTKSDRVLSSEEVADNIAYLASPLRDVVIDNGHVVTLLGFNL